MNSQLWPLFDLRIRTSSLEYRYPGDEDLPALVAMVERIRREPGLDWWWKNTLDGDGALDDYATRALQRLWEWRAGWRTTKWMLPLVAIHNQDVIGVVEIYSSDFGSLRSAEIGIWVDPPMHRRGFGRQMTQVALYFAFELLHAEEVRWSAPVDNEASIALASSLGFVDNGTTRLLYCGEPFEERLFRIDAAKWDGGALDVTVEGFEPCRSFFGVGE